MRSIILFFVFIYSFNSSACTCKVINKITKDEIVKVDVVFIGTIKSILFDESGYFLTATFEITKNLKGVSEKSIITVQTNISGASCGLNFEKGQKWYIFAHFYKGKLITGLCGRSVQLSKVSFNTKRFFIGHKNYRRMKKTVRQDKRAIQKLIGNESKRHLKDINYIH